MTSWLEKFYITFFLLLWFCLSLSFNVLGFYNPNASRLPLAFVNSIIFPPLIFAVAYRYSERVREITHKLDLRLLTSLQAWRVLGGMFLVLYLHGLLPGMFAWPAAVGDLIVGIYAPFVAIAITNHTKHWPHHVFALSVIGLLDFAWALGTGLLSSSSPLGLLAGTVTTDLMQRLPLSLIPTFLVPLWIVFHIISLLQIREKLSFRR